MMLVSVARDLAEGKRNSTSLLILEGFENQ